MQPGAFNTRLAPAARPLRESSPVYIAPSLLPFLIPPRVEWSVKGFLLHAYCARARRRRGTYVGLLPHTGLPSVSTAPAIANAASSRCVAVRRISLAHTPGLRQLPSGHAFAFAQTYVRTYARTRRLLSPARVRSRFFSRLHPPGNTLLTWEHAQLGSVTRPTERLRGRTPPRP